MNNNLAVLRAEESMTQGDLASAVGTSRQTIISIEKGRYDPGLKLAMRLAQVFDVAVEQLFNLDD